MIGSKEWENYHKIFSDENFVISDKIKISEEEIRQKIMMIIEGKKPHEIEIWPKVKRDGVLRLLREQE